MGLFVQKFVKKESTVILDYIIYRCRKRDVQMQIFNAW